MDEHQECSMNNFRELKAELRELKEIVTQDITTLKLYQEKCMTHWGLVGKILGISSVGGVLSGLVAFLFGPHK